jgi:glycosyltransferase involved in cell wall biosynthesis
MDALMDRDDVDLVRVDAQRNLITAGMLRVAGGIRGYGIWKYGGANRRLTDARVRRGVSRTHVDATVAVADVETALDVPTLLYQDANLSVAAAHSDLLIEHAPALVRFPAGRLEELVAEQRAAYQAAACVLTFSQWFASWLVEHDGVPQDRIRVVGGGLHGLPEKRRLERDPSDRTRVLFIGREFHRKGGPLVVAAIERLRAAGAGPFTLTIVGPSAWPLRSPIPEWVHFRGPVPATQVRRLWREHDIFAMPTWYEPYGLVFLEARAAGLPSVGRDAFCMRELVPDTAGRLIPVNGGVEDVAESLLAISQDANLFEALAAGADSVAADHSWSRVAERTTLAVREAVRAA